MQRFFGMSEIDTIYKIGPLTVALIGAIAWLIRVEAKVLYLEKDHRDHKEVTKVREDDIRGKMDKLQETNISILQSLARIETEVKSIHQKG